MRFPNYARFKASVLIYDEDFKANRWMTFFSDDREFKDIFASIKANRTKVFEVNIYEIRGHMQAWELIETRHSLEKEQ